MQENEVGANDEIGIAFVCNFPGMFFSLIKHGSPSLKCIYYIFKVEYIPIKNVTSRSIIATTGGGRHPPAVEV